MTIDARIPLSGIAQPVLSAGERVNLLQLTQQARQQSAMRNVMRDPESIDPGTGLPTVRGLIRMSQIDPEFGAQAARQRAQTLAQMSQDARESAKFKMGQDQAIGVELKKANEDAVRAFMGATQRGVPRAEAFRQARDTYQKGVNDFFRSGRASVYGADEAHRQAYLEKAPNSPEELFVSLQAISDGLQAYALADEGEPAQPKAAALRPTPVAAPMAAPSVAQQVPAQDATVPLSQLAQEPQPGIPPSPEGQEPSPVSEYYDIEREREQALQAMGGPAATPEVQQPMPQADIAPGVPMQAAPAQGEPIAPDEAEPQGVQGFTPPETYVQLRKQAIAWDEKATRALRMGNMEAFKEARKQAKDTRDAADKLEDNALKEQELQDKREERLDKQMERRAAEGNTLKTQSTKLSDDFRQEPGVKDYRAVQPLIASMETAVKRNTAAADLDIVYAIAKIFDPGSVVRESEQILVVKSGGLPSQVQSALGYVIGGQRLSDDLRKGLLAQAKSRASNYKQAYDSAVRSYVDQANRWGIDPRDVVREYKVEAKPDKKFIKNPKTGEVLESTDGGKTWQPRK